MKLRKGKNIIDNFCNAWRYAIRVLTAISKNLRGLVVANLYANNKYQQALVRICIKIIALLIVIYLYWDWRHGILDWIGICSPRRHRILDWN